MFNKNSPFEITNEMLSAVIEISELANCPAGATVLAAAPSPLRW